MTDHPTCPKDDECNDFEEEETIANGLEKMEFLYKSRSIEIPKRSNVIVREITKDK